MWRMSIAEWLLGVAMAFIAAPVAALDAPLDPPGSSTFRVVPAQPTTRDFIAIRNDFTGCNIHGPIKAQEIRVDVAAHTVDYLIPYGDDMSGCEPDGYVQDAFADSAVGYLPPGSYTVRFFDCGMLYDPQATCDELANPRLQFVVIDAGPPHQTIPASSPRTRFTLLVVLVLAAAWRLRRR
jgi:hypothetical protein